MNKPEYILKFEKNSGIFSVVSAPDKKYNIDYLDNKFTFVWGRSNYIDGFEWVEKLYITKQNFFIYLFLENGQSKMNLYYLSSQQNEMSFFIKNLLKEI